MWYNYSYMPFNFNSGSLKTWMWSLIHVIILVNLCQWRGLLFLLVPIWLFVENCLTKVQGQICVNHLIGNYRFCIQSYFCMYIHSCRWLCMNGGRDGLWVPTCLCLYTLLKSVPIIFPLIWFYSGIAFSYQVICSVIFHKRSLYSFLLCINTCSWV